jgi:hypothetical protein
MSRESTLPNKFPVIGKDDQDPDSGIDDRRALDKLAVQYPKDAAAAYDPGPFRERGCCLSHPAKQRTPGLLFDREEEEDVAYMYAFMRRAVILWQQVGAQFYKYRRLYQGLRPSICLNMEAVQIDRTSEGDMC